MKLTKSKLREMIREVMTEARSSWPLRGWNRSEIYDLDSGLVDMGMTAKIDYEIKGNKLILTNKGIKQKLNKHVDDYMKPGGIFVAKNGKPYPY